MKKKLSFKKFMKENGEKGVCKVAADYAAMEDSVTIYVLSEKYNISKGAVRSAIRYSVENCLVSYSLSSKMKSKAHRNQKRHSNDSNSVPTSSDKYYERLFNSRDTKIVMSLKSKIQDILEKMEYYKKVTPNTPEELKEKETLEKELKDLDSILSNFFKKD